jgi:hypothetical protein
MSDLLTAQFRDTLAWVAEDQKAHRRFDDEAGEVFGVQAPWSPEVTLLLDLLERLKAGEIACVAVEQTPLVLPPCYRHLYAVCRGEVRVGYLSFWGYAPRFLPAEDVQRAGDREKWLDEESWRGYVGGTAGDFRIELMRISETT